MGKYEEALQKYSESLKIKEKMKGDNTIECASTINNKGLVYFNLGNYQQALLEYEKCLKIQSMKGTDSIDYNLTLINKGTVFLNQGKYVQAL
jgi:tetratricopeptide (TPR) repeat protein